MRARSLFPLILIVSGAFGAGWLMGRFDPDAEGTGTPSASASAGNQRVSPSSSGKAVAGASGMAINSAPAAVAGGGDPDFPDVFDPLVLAALRSPDLVAAVKELMARQEEDHCADTRIVQLVEALPEARLAELPALLTAFAGDKYVSKFILMPWAERQPEAALAYVNSRHDSAAGTLLPHVLTGWTRKDPDAAAVWMEALPLSSHSRELQTTLIGTLSESDPDRALALMREKGWTTNASAIQALLKNQGGTDPEGALKSLRGLVTLLDEGAGCATTPSGPSFPRTIGKLNPQYDTLLGALLSGASNRPASEFSALMAKLTPQEIRDGASSLFTDGLAVHPELTESILSHTKASEQDCELIKALARQNGGLAVSLLGKTADPSLRAEMLQSISWGFERSGGAPPPLDHDNQARQSILETLATLPEAERDAQGSVVALGLAANSPTLAGEIWKGLNPGAQEKSGAMFFKNMAGGQSSQAALELWRNSSPDIQTATLQGLAAGLGATAPDEAISLAMAQSDPQLKAKTVAATLAFWAEQSPDQAAAAMENLLPQLDPAELERALSQAGIFQTSGSSNYFYLKNKQELLTRLKALRPVP